jgi:hypothetical protein
MTDRKQRQGKQKGVREKITPKTPNASDLLSPATLKFLEPVKIAPQA